MSERLRDWLGERVEIREVRYDVPRRRRCCGRNIGGQASRTTVLEESVTENVSISLKLNVRAVNEWVLFHIIEVREILVFLVFRDEFKGSGLNLKLHLIPADLSSLKNGSASDSVFDWARNLGSAKAGITILQTLPPTRYPLYPPPASNRPPSRL